MSNDTLTAEPVEVPEAPVAQLGADSQDAELVEDELLVEEISIDGMCGVY